MKNIYLLIILAFCVTTKAQQSVDLSAELREQIKLYAITGYNNWIAQQLKLSQGRVVEYNFISQNHIFSERCDFTSLQIDRQTDYELYYSYSRFSSKKPMRLTLLNRGAISIVNDLKDFRKFVLNAKISADPQSLAILYLLLTEETFYWRKLILTEKDFEKFSPRDSSEFEYKDFCLRPDELGDYKMYPLIKSKIATAFTKSTGKICVTDSNGEIIQYTFIFDGNNVKDVNSTVIANLKTGKK